uniref:Peptidase_M14 domain-containing protein n=1 Tax=Macrostomum lignano TaxID=282301 RepID=A0A1I8FJT3_9PLAT
GSIFAVSNTEPGQAYRFTLVNFYKSASLYNEGLRPLMYSCRAAKLRGAVEKMRLRHQVLQEQPALYSSQLAVIPKRHLFNPHGSYNRRKRLGEVSTLADWPRFEFLDDTVYFAHCYPYTYSDLLDYLQSLQADAGCVRLLQAAGPLPLLGWQRRSPAHHRHAGGAAKGRRKTAAAAAVEKAVTSRVHPGESNASWMMKGFLDHLTGQHPDACLLRDCFTFKVVPMINPDGVIVGNYRCSLAGRDLNRNYRSPLRDSFPAVCAIVDLVSRLQARGVRVALYCDLHGHSRRQNVFMYGCAPTSHCQCPSACPSAVFPAMMSRNAPDKFEQDSCKFRMQKSKEGTGRIVMYRLGIRCAYTMEATFCGSTLGGLAGFHFTCRHLEQMGAHLCDSMLDYFDPSGGQASWKRRLRVQILINLQRSGLAAGLSDPEQLDLANLPDIVAADGSAADDPEEVGDSSDDGGSDSSVSDGLPAHFEFMAESGRPSRRTRSRRERPPEEAAQSEGVGGRCWRRRAASSLKGDSGPQQFRQPKGRYFATTCGSARCPHSQQPTGDKSVPSAPGSRQKSRASQQASRGDAITMATTPTTSANSHSRAEYGAPRSHRIQLFKLRRAAASAAVSVGHGAVQPDADFLLSAAQRGASHNYRLETIEYLLASTAARAVSLDESNSRIGGRRSKAAAATAASAGGAAQPAAALQGQPGVPSLAAAAALTESVDS